MILHVNEKCSLKTVRKCLYVKFVPIFYLGCFILECAPGLANDLILTIGQAFELKYKEYLNKNTVIQATVPKYVNLNKS